MAVAVADLPRYADQLDAIASDAGLDPSEKVAELRRVVSRIQADADPADQDTEDLLGQAASYIGAAQLQQEAGAIDGQLDLAGVREDADVRDALVASGLATPEQLDTAGWPTHDSLDQASEDGTLEEAYGLGLLHGEDFNAKVKRDHGEFSSMNVAGAAPAPGAPAAPAATKMPKMPKGPTPPPLSQRGGGRKPLRGGPAAPIRPGQPAGAAMPEPGAAPEAAPEAPPAPALDASPERQATDAALKAMFNPDETVKPTQNFDSPEALFAQAQKDAPDFEALLTRDLAEAMGAATPDTLESALGNAESNPDAPQVVMGPMKQMERAKEKVDTKYDGDWNKLQDVLRATVVVPSLEHMPAAVQQVREHAEASGWTIQKAENRYSDPPPPHNVGPTSAGYRDTAVALVSPGGIVAELQLNTAPMFQAKQGDGHALYEQARSLEAQIKQRVGGSGSGMKSPGTLGPTDDELRQLDGFEQQSKALYHDAWERSYAA